MLGRAVLFVRPCPPHTRCARTPTCWHGQKVQFKSVGLQLHPSGNVTDTRIFLPKYKNMHVTCSWAACTANTRTAEAYQRSCQGSQQAGDSLVKGICRGAQVVRDDLQREGYLLCYMPCIGTSPCWRLGMRAQVLSQQSRFCPCSIRASDVFRGCMHALLAHVSSDSLQHQSSMPRQF